MRVTGVATVSVGTMGITVHMTSCAVDVLVGLRRHRSYSTRVALVSAVEVLEYG
ncbi:MAG TPA: hypothetical protein VN974_01530 [Candidatus Dormibacteraeota bacterium]|nr:hypothetical protein [Candidatus Dormibacteraeota bacterium]